ncbi:MAG: hypothetical protein R3A51_17970, partial [Nannocystaceae bacterium]
VRDAGGEAPIGVCRESFVILPPRSLEPAIEAARHSRRLSEIERSGRPEAVIRYTKDVTLDSAALKEELAGLEGLQDVIRFNLGHLRDRMDTPREDHRLVDPQTGRVEVIPCARVYHLNLVLRLTVGSGATRRQTIERVRVVLDQNGIKRVEFLDANGRVSTTTPA